MNEFEGFELVLVLAQAPYDEKEAGVPVRSPNPTVPHRTNINTQNPTCAGGEFSRRQQQVGDVTDYAATRYYEVFNE